MPSSYEIHKSGNGQFNFVLKAENDQVILRSEQYESKPAAQNGIASVRANNPHDERYEKKDSSDGRSYFNLKAVNHQVIGASQMYASVQARDAGISSVKDNGPTSTIEDKT
jgi:uncharacterized protein YegP (UPF0339 family)